MNAQENTKQIFATALEQESLAEREKYLAERHRRRARIADPVASGAFAARNKLIYPKTTMKHRFLFQLRWNVSAGMAVLLAGCAHFQHQTSEVEPHGLVVVVKPVDLAGDAGVVKKFDGLAVSTGQTYRVKPGEHTVIVQYVETVVETSKPLSYGLGTPMEQPANLHLSESGRATVTGQQPFSGMQPVNLSVESRRIRYITNSISVQAGWRYELDGDRVTTKPSEASDRPAQR